MRGVTIATLLIYVAPQLLSQQNPTYTLLFQGLCDTVWEGNPGAIVDDGTMGLPDFERGQPGVNIDVVLRIADNEFALNNQRWDFGVAVDGAFTIVDITTNGTVGCAVPKPGCYRRGSGYSLTEITGPPSGTGPQEESNKGALSSVLLSVEPVGLPPEGDFVICRLRISGVLPDTVGRTAGGTLIFTTRTGSTGEPIAPTVYRELINPITTTLGDPPLSTEVCDILMKAVPEAPFIRCDANGDGDVNISDPVWLLNELFRGGPPSLCPIARDCNNDGDVNITDAIYALLYLFGGGPTPPLPFPECGSVDGTTSADCSRGSSHC